MSLPDVDQAAALDASVIKPVFFAYLDIDGDPIRANTSGHDITPVGSGDPDLDGHLFTGINGEFVDISPVKFQQGGSDSVTATISGIPGLDDDILGVIEDPTNWRSRDARLWRIVRNASNVQQGGFHAYYTGKMTALKHSGSAESQQLSVTIESYLAVFSVASNRTYLDQERYDSGDLSARAAIAIANGNYTGAGSGSGGVGYGGGVGAGGAYCVADDTPILLAEGIEVPASCLTPAIRLLTRPELDDGSIGEWGEYEITAIAFADEPVFRCFMVGWREPIRATARHRFGINNAWVHAEDIGTPDGIARVAKISTTGGTYMSAGVLSHNIKAGYGGVA